MTTKSIGLGTQLRHAIALLDGDLQKIYDQKLPGYRPRYTPIVRALSDKSPATIQDVCKFSGLTQSAASQTVSIMLREGWVERQKTADARQSAIALTTHGKESLKVLETLWAATRAAADQLERELSFSITELLAEMTERLNEKSFIERIGEQDS